MDKQNTEGSVFSSELKNLTNYEGNGWTKYQLVVLNLLNDHTQSIKKLHSDNSEIRTALAVSNSTEKSFKETLEKNIDSILDDLENLSKSQNGLADKIEKIETNQKINSAVYGKIKILWGVIGAGAAFIFNLLFTKMPKIIEFFQHIHSE